MSSIVTEQGIVHYEAIGRGRPVIFLHGWLGSWAYWIDTMNVLASHCRSYALDFWGFGESDHKRASFTVPDFIALVVQFMDRLGIASAALVGHSMGGTVALGVALAHPDRVTRVAVVGSPIVGTSLNFFLKMAGQPFWAFLAYTFPAVVKAGTYLASPTHHPGLADMVSDVGARSLPNHPSLVFPEHRQSPSHRPAAVAPPAASSGPGDLWGPR